MRIISTLIVACLLGACTVPTTFMMEQASARICCTNGDLRLVGDAPEASRGDFDWNVKCEDRQFTCRQQIVDHKAIVSCESDDGDESRLTDGCSPPTDEDFGVGSVLKCSRVLRPVLVESAPSGTDKNLVNHHFEETQEEFNPSKADGLSVAPRLDSQLAHVYPARASAYRIHGVVLLRVQSRDDGSVREVQVAKSPSAILSKSAATEMCHARFTPALDKQGKAVAVIISYRYRYVLDSR